MLRQYKKVMAFAVVVTMGNLSGCGFFNNTPGIEKDKNEQQEVLDGLFVTYWKGAKISIRSIPVDENTQKIDFESIKNQQADKLNLGKHLRRIYDFESFLKDEEVEDVEPLSSKEFVEVSKEIYSMSDSIKDMDEDDYPTFAEIIHHSSRILQDEPVNMPSDWNNSMDHWMFALVMESRFGFGSWKTYELSKVNPDELMTSDYRIMASLHKGTDDLRNKWYYLADENFTKAINEASDTEITLQNYTKNLLVNNKIGDFTPEEQFGVIIRANSYLMRGFARHQADNSELNEKALEDIEAALVEFKNLGIENELVWMAESYLYIKNENTEKAIASLTKLEKSLYLTHKEKALIAETKQQILDRDPESALNSLTDKVIFYRLGFNYVMSYASEIQWLKILEQTEQGKRILERFSELEKTYEKVKSYLDVDNLKEKATSNLKELIE
jgi:hypothetical protein